MIATVALKGRKGEMDACSNLIASEEAINEDLAKRDPSYVYLKRREGGPKGRQSEESLKVFLSGGRILVNIWSTKNRQKTDTNLRQ